jgi:hypothetical protein
MKGIASEEYCTERRGENLVRAFLAGLDRRDRVDAFALLKLLAERGNTLRLPHSHTRELWATACLSCAASRSGCSTCFALAGGASCSMA